MDHTYSLSTDRLPSPIVWDEDLGSYDFGVAARWDVHTRIPGVPDYEPMIHIALWLLLAPFALEVATPFLHTFPLTELKLVLRFRLGHCYMRYPPVVHAVSIYIYLMPFL